jgi:hypothetical protein
MENLINKTNSFADSPQASQEWKKRSEKERILQIIEKLNINLKINNFEVFSAQEDGQVVLRTSKSTPAKERGIELLEIEEMLKKSIDEGITVWLEPVGDKSKLRNLRGITFKTIE